MEVLGSKRFPKSLSKLLRGFSPNRYSRRVRLPAKMLHLHCNIRMYTVIYSTPQTQFLGESAGRLTSWASLFHPYTIEYDKRKNRTAETQLNVERLPLQLATLLRLACLRTMALLLHSNCHLWTTKHYGWDYALSLICCSFHGDLLLPWRSCLQFSLRVIATQHSDFNKVQYTTKTNLKPAIQYNFSTVRFLDVTCAIYTQLGHSRKVERLGNADLSSAQLHREKGAQNDRSCIWNVHGIPQSAVRVAQLLPLQPLTTVAVASWLQYRKAQQRCFLSSCKPPGNQLWKNLTPTVQ